MVDRILDLNRIWILKLSVCRTGVGFEKLESVHL